MSTIVKAFVGAQIHDGKALLDGHALVLDRDGGLAVQATTALPQGCPTHDLGGGLITPGFVDLQVNGGGGVMFNDDPSVASLHSIAAAHATMGTMTLLPTLITDTPARTDAALNAVEQAIAQKVAGIAGIHLEGPHLSVARKGAHDASLIRPMTDADLATLCRAADRLPNVMVTVAPENVTLAQIKAMAGAGIIVSLGHTDADSDTCHRAFDAGARCVTHLFNAMSQMMARAPGLVGATLERDDVFAGLIADGIHVDPASIRIALAAKPRSDRIFLVTDAMATAGSGIDGFLLNGRRVSRKDHHLTLADGTLAGADLDMPRALSVMVDEVADSVAQAVARATATPAAVLRHPGAAGGFEGLTTAALYFAKEFSTPRVLSAQNQPDAD